MAQITTEKYDIVKLERLKHFLESNVEKGKPKFYEIFVDNLKAVDKTSDPSCFDEYQMYQNNDTRMIKVLIYTSTENCPRNDKFIFTLRDPYNEKQQEELSGLEVENKISSAIEQERNRIQLEQLQKELEEVKSELEDCEDYNEKLEAQLQQCKQEFEASRKRKVTLTEINAGNLVGFATDYFIKNYPGISNKVPLLSSLSGLLTNEDAEDQSPRVNDENKPPINGHASFARKQTAEALNQLDETTQRKLNFFNQIEAAFDEDQLEKVIDIIHGLGASPEQIDTVHSLLLSEDSN